MDPTACLTEALEALDAIGDDPGERQTAIERLRGLADWLERGGFPPLVELAMEQANYRCLAG